MFEALSDKLSGVFDRLRTRGSLNEADVTEALREVRLALLDADVALPVVRDFIAKVRERAVGAEVMTSVTPGQQVVKIVNDVMIESLGGEGAVAINLNAAAPVPILMVGLQGSGKTNDLRQDRSAAQGPAEAPCAAGEPGHPAARGAVAVGAACRSGRRAKPADHGRADAGADRAPRHGCRPA